MTFQWYACIHISYCGVLRNKWDLFKVSEPFQFERNDEKEREAHGMALFKFPKNKSAKQMFSVKV